METDHGLWRAVRTPLAVLAVAGLGIIVAVVLDKVFRSEWSLTIGAPSLGLVLPLGAVWFVVALVVHARSGKGRD